MKGRKKNVRVDGEHPLRLKILVRNCISIAEDF
jgi:hypothetical protein